MITENEVRAALRTVADPCAIATGVPVDVVAMGLVAKVTLDGADVTVVLQLTSPFCMQVGLMSEQLTIALRRLPGVGEVTIEVDHSAEWLPELMEPAATAALRTVRPLPVVAR
ncbi:metal-sulfur cluster assembly factor [Amycolatopsis sp. NPDC051903]|uniref:metal-sulfur cluster assembly factor n=1 Tax=Amycolatopsis sp. NPDC051903 TaxID=3363936 RepID=UPI00379C2877